MENFTKVLLREYRQGVIYTDENNQELENYFIEDLRNYVNNVIDDTNSYFKYLDDFMTNAPLELWSEVANEIHLEYCVLELDMDMQLYNERTEYLRPKKGNLLKKEDIAILQKSLTILEKFFKISYGNVEINKIIDIPKDLELPTEYYNGILARETILNLIEDINNGKKDIPYYRKHMGLKKEKLKNYLLDINKRYNLKQSKNIQNFIKNLTVYQIANL